MRKALAVALLASLTMTGACSKSDQKSAPVDTTLVDDDPAAQAPAPSPTELSPDAASKPINSKRSSRQTAAQDVYEDDDLGDYKEPPPSPGSASAAASLSGPSPKGNPGFWVTTNDDPTRALREERAGTTAFRVTVGPDGYVTACTITSTSGSPDLDEATCSNVTRRARFSPAIDANGNPTTGSYSNRIRWTIPTD